MREASNQVQQNSLILLAENQLNSSILSYLSLSEFSANILDFIYITGEAWEQAGGKGQANDCLQKWMWVSGGHWVWPLRFNDPPWWGLDPSGCPGTLRVQTIRTACF